MADERVLAAKACRQFLYDLNNEKTVIDEDVIKLHLNSALNVMGEWRPLRKLTTLSLDVTKFDYPLPADFVTIDLDSFNHAVNPAQLSYMWNGQTYELGYSSAAKQMQSLPPIPGLGGGFPFGAYNPPYGQSSSIAFGMFFIPGNRFEFANGANGTRIMYTSPKPAKTGSLQFLYQARHTITADTGTDPDIVLGYNTVAEEDRDMLWLKVGELSGITMQRKMAADRYAARNFQHFSEACEKAFMARAAVFTWGG